MYTARLLDYFEHPRNAGEIDEPDATAQIENPACGDVLKLSLRTAEGRIRDARFKAKGCVPAMACASALTDLIAGRTFEEARALRREHLMDAVGGLPPASIHAAQLALDALRAALAKLAPQS